VLLNIHNLKVLTKRRKTGIDRKNILATSFVDSLDESSFTVYRVSRNSILYINLSCNKYFTLQKVTKAQRGE
jgi:hypothetical protein